MFVLEWLKDQWEYGDKLVAAVMAIAAITIAWLIVGTVAETKKTAKAKQEFMAECLTERKQYECTALWRAGEAGSDLVVVPIVTRR